MPLFYDLILVAIIGRATYVYGNNPTWETLGFVFLSLLIVFVIWATTTLELLLAEQETWTQRGLMFVQVSALLVAGLAMYRGGGISDRWGFISLCVAFLTIAGLQFTRRKHKGQKELDNLMLAASLIGAGLFAWGAIFPMGFTIGDGILIAWINYPIAIIFTTVAMFVLAPRLLVENSQIHSREVNERFGVLYLIVLGDTFLHIIHSLGYLRILPRPDYLILTLVFIFAVWTLYFPTISEPAFKTKVSGARARVIAHFVLVVSTAFSIVAYVSMTSAEYLESDTPENYSWSVLPIIGIILSIWWLTLLHDGRHSSSTTAHLIAAGVLVGIGVLASVMSVFSWETGLVLAVFVVLIDALVVLFLRGDISLPGRKQLSTESAHSGRIKKADSQSL